jgi:hypothetical protein
LSELRNLDWGISWLQIAIYEVFGPIMHFLVLGPLWWGLIAPPLLMINLLHLPINIWKLEFKDFSKSLNGNFSINVQISKLQDQFLLSLLLSFIFLPLLWLSSGTPDITCIINLGGVSNWAYPMVVVHIILKKLHIKHVLVISICYIPI